jgi:hypothetical protein
MVGAMVTWAPWVQERLDMIEEQKSRSRLWQAAEREWFQLTYLFQKGVVVEFRSKGPRQRAKESINAA